MKPPRFKRFLAEDFPTAPDWFKQFLSILSEPLTDITNALTRRLSRADNFLSRAKPLDFTTPAGTSTNPLLIANDMDVRPTAAWVGQLYKNDGTVMSAAFSMAWQLTQSNQLQLVFTGLEATTRYKGVLIYEG